MPKSFLLVLSDARGLSWVLANQRMAFPPRRHAEVDALEPGDELLLVTTRGCFGNPTRDRTRIIGRATVTSQVVRLQDPVRIAEREFTRGCDLDITRLAPFRTGTELSPLVKSLAAFPNKRAWSMWMRRPLLPLSPTDSATIRAAIGEFVQDPRDSTPTYLEWTSARFGE